MDVIISQPTETIREIEDIIDIQKARGNFSKQVAFNLLSECESSISTNVAKSLESGLSSTKSERLHKKKGRCKRYKTPLPDAISWPSDSDITVLRMKINLTKSKLKKKVRNTIPGDGLHQPDSSSMVNLATLMDEPKVPQPPSKQSISIEEYLLPLTSWEREEDNETAEPKLAEENILDSNLPKLDEIENYPNNRQDYEYGSQSDKRSKIARFLRLYFCPCCTCLYKMENMSISDERSTYWSKRKELTV